MSRIFIGPAPGCSRPKLLVDVEWFNEGYRIERLDHVMKDDPEMVNQFLSLNPATKKIIQGYKKAMRRPKRNYYPLAK
jgi:hypothetical protein